MPVAIIQLMPFNLAKELRKHWPVTVVLALFVASIFFVGFHGDFAVNDDWIFVRQVEAFVTGLGWELNAQIDPSFVGQGLAGFVWAKIFGSGFVSLRILTLAFSVVLLFTSYKILHLLKIDEKLSFVALALITFNPLIFTSSFSFMSEIYFLVYFAAGVYFYLKYLKADDKAQNMADVLLGSVFVGLAILVRQVGITTYIAFLLAAVFYKKLGWKTFVTSFLPVGIAVWVFSVWPRYLTTELSGSLAGLLSNLIEAEDILARLGDLLWSLPYFALFLMPSLLTFNKVKFTKKSLVVGAIFLAFASLISYHLYLADIFRLGNVFYVEGLFVKSNFRSNFHIFNNIPFKMLLAFLISLALVRFATFFKFAKKLDPTSLFLLLTTLGSFAILTFGNDLYDRYLLPSFLSLVFFVLYYFKGLIRFEAKWQWASLILVVALAIFHQHEYLSHTRLRWEFANRVHMETGYLNSIAVGGTYAKYFSAVEDEDYIGLEGGEPAVGFVCFVEDYTIDTTGILFRFGEWFDQLSKRAVENPDVFDARRTTSLSSAKKNLDKLLYNQEYFSPEFNLIGKRAFVAAWCDDIE